MKTRNITCIVCPIGCEISVKYDQVKGEIKSVVGATCKRGEKYVEKEIFNPERVLTSSVIVGDGELPLVSIRTNRAVPKEKIISLMDIVNKQKVQAPVTIGDIIVANPLDLDCDIVATKSVRKKQ